MSPSGEAADSAIRGRPCSPTAVLRGNRLAILRMDPTVPVLCGAGIDAGAEAEQAIHLRRPPLRLGTLAILPARRRDALRLGHGPMHAFLLGDVGQRAGKPIVAPFATLDRVPYAIGMNQAIANFVAFPLGARCDRYRQPAGGLRVESRRPRRHLNSTSRPC